MGLIICKECSGMVSEFAASCPHCGFSISKPEMAESVERPKKIEELSICMHCGWIPGCYRSTCPYCGSKSRQYDTGVDERVVAHMTCEERMAFKKDILENVIKKGPDFSQAAYEETQKKYERFNYESIHGRSSWSYTATCPYCGSTKTRKISRGGRIFSTGFLGLGSSTIGNQWHCKDCGSDF